MHLSEAATPGLRNPLPPSWHNYSVLRRITITWNTNGAQQREMDD